LVNGLLQTVTKTSATPSSRRQTKTPPTTTAWPQSPRRPWRPKSLRRLHHSTGQAGNPPNCRRLRAGLAEKCSTMQNLQLTDSVNKSWQKQSNSSKAMTKPRTSMQGWTHMPTRSNVTPKILSLRQKTTKMTTRSSRTQHQRKARLSRSRWWRMTRRP